MRATLTDAEWAAFDADGFVVLDDAADPALLATLNDRLNEIMDGKVQCEWSETLLSSSAGVV